METMYSNYETYQITHTTQPVSKLLEWAKNSDINIIIRKNNPDIFANQDSKKETSKK